MPTIREMTNEEIVSKLQVQFEDVLFIELYRRFKPLIYSGIKLYKIPLFTPADYCQEGRIALYHAVQRYDENRNAHFARFVQLVYKSHMYNIFRYETAKKRGGREGKHSFEYRIYERPLYEEGSVLEVKEQTLFFQPEDRVMVREQTHSYFTRLSKLERKVFVHFLQGMDMEEIAESLQIPATKVGSAYDRCRQKLRKMLRDSGIT
ncbi:sigma-70 family RNA polymerase sigma factor [Aerococcaceae bacterium NML190938]|nr:sigma-70 family RNA polymerase sigma factor [Aerococcaceae bacterium NML190938]